MIEKEPTLKVALCVWWALLWRSFLIALLGGFVIGVLVGIVSAVAGVELGIFSILLSSLFGMGVGIWIIQILLTKGTKQWRLAVIEK